MGKQGIDRFLYAAGFGLLLGLSACSKPASTAEGVGLDGVTGIIGGETVLDGDPVGGSTVAIINKRYNQVVCTGSLVSENLVVTAGHCTTETPGDLAILFAHKLPKKRGEAAKLEQRPVIAGQTHPNWPKNDFQTDKDWGDIALLRFDGQLPKNYAPARLLTKIDHLKVGMRSILAGYGWTNGVRRTEADGLNKTSVKIENPAFSKTEILFNQTEGTGACHGDSGGPAFVELNGELLLIGVTSRGHDDPNDTCEHFAIYSSLLAHADWMKETALYLQSPEAIGQKMPQPF